MLVLPEAYANPGANGAARAHLPASERCVRLTGMPISWRRLRGKGAQDVPKAPPTQDDPNAVLEMIESLDRTGSSIRQTSPGSDARVHATPARIDAGRRRPARAWRRKDQFKLGKLWINDNAGPKIWTAVLAA